MTDVERVVMLTNALAPDKLGGIERYFRELAGALVRKGIEVTVLTKNVTGSDLDVEVGADGVRVVRHRVPDKRHPLFAFKYPISVATAVWRELPKSSRTCVIHGQYPITTLPVAVGHRPYVYTFQAPVHKEMLLERAGSYFLPSPVQRAAVRSLRVAERRVVVRAGATVVLSQFMRGELGALDPAVGAASRLLPGGVDTAFFAPGRAVRGEWESDASPLLFAARRLTLRTGVMELVEAMPAVLRHHPLARLAVAGEGSQRARIESEIRRLGIGERVRLLGRVSDDELLAWYRLADLSVTPTQQLEGFGLATAESLAAGTPALVTPVGANPELVGGLDPLLVAPGSAPADIAAGICGLLGRPGLLARLATRAREIADPAWSWDSVASRYLTLYHEVL